MNIINILKNPKNYLMLFQKRFLSSKYKVIINGKTFFVRYHPFWDDASSKKWEPNTFLIFDRFIDKNHSFIDIGAWIGPTTLYGSQLSKRCYSFEPDPIAFKELKNNVILNPDLKQKIELYDYCISNKSGKIRFGNRSNFGDSMSSILFSDLKKSLFVKSITLQKFIQQKKINDCNFIKIDIEGGETIVLPHIKKFLEKNKPTLHLSLHPQFFNDLEKDSKLIIKTLKIYKNIFNNRGQLLTLDVLISDFLLKRQGCDIVATDINWS
jgi:FkbM family methyltransferase